MRRLALAPVATLLAGLALSAEARVLEFRLDAIEPFADGESFGEHGSYVRVRGVAHGAPTTRKTP
jgi:hypothetical protein